MGVIRGGISAPETADSAMSLMLLMISEPPPKLLAPRLLVSALAALAGSVGIDEVSLPDEPPVAPPEPPLLSLLSASMMEDAADAAVSGEASAVPSDWGLIPNNPDCSTASEIPPPTPLSEVAAAPEVPAAPVPEDSPPEAATAPPGGGPAEGVMNLSHGRSIAVSKP